MAPIVKVRSMVRPMQSAAPTAQSEPPALPTKNRLTIDDAPFVTIRDGIKGRYGTCPIHSLRSDPNSVRTHPKRQIKKLKSAIEATGVVAPVVVDETWLVLAGHARISACRELGRTEVPVLQIHGASEAQKRIFSLADNRIPEDAGWDRERLASLIPDISKLLAEANFSIDTLGFDTAQLDELKLDFEPSSQPAEDRIDERLLKAPRVLQAGDHLKLGDHGLMVADARDAAALDTLCNGTQVAAVITDPPYNVKVRSIVGRGRIQHEEFAFASGEMSREEFKAFLRDALSNAIRVSTPAALHYVFIDRKHVRELLEVGEAIYEANLDLIVWNKTNPGQGGIYRSQHELIPLFRVGADQHRDNVQMGRFGRNRSNVWTYPGVNTFRAGRMEDLAAHPTVKPMQMIAEAIKDCTQLGDTVLDLFAGSGTILLAAEKVGRRALAMEIEPKYADVAVRRWQAMTGRDAIHVETELTFDELASERAS